MKQTLNEIAASVVKRKVASLVPAAPQAVLHFSVWAQAVDDYFTVEQRARAAKKIADAAKSERKRKGRLAEADGIIAEKPRLYKYICHSIHLARLGIDPGYAERVIKRAESGLNNPAKYGDWKALSKLGLVT